MLGWFTKKRNSTRQPLSPEELERLDFGAETIVEFFQEQLNLKIDYSPQCLEKIDSFVLGLRDEGEQPENLTYLLYSLGCYVGKVMCIHLHGKWVHASDTDLASGFRSEVVQLRNEVLWNPIGKIEKLLVNGSEDSVAHMFKEAAR